MSQGKNERKSSSDERDIFEKALDYGPEIIGGGIGAVIGAKLSKKASKSYVKQKRDELGHQRRILRDIEENPRDWDGFSPDEVRGEMSGYSKRFSNAKRQAAAFKLMGITAGGLAGMATGSAIREKKKK